MSTVEYKCVSLNIKKSTNEHKYELLNINVNLEQHYIIAEYSNSLFLNIFKSMC